MKNMKIKLLLVLTIIAINKPKSQTVHFTFNPDKMGIGGIIEVPASKNFGALGSFDEGSYYFINERMDVYKYGAGVRYKWFILLYQYSEFKHDEDTWFKIDLLYKHSIEMGAITYATDHFGVGIFGDLLNSEFRVSVFYNFNLKRRRE